MAHLFAYTCNQPKHVAQALAPLRHVLITRGPVARWGFGYVQNDEVLLAHMPRPSKHDIDWYERLGDVRSSHVIAHASVEDGLRGPENTQPFRYRRWLFAQDVAVEARAGALEAVLAQWIPSFLRRRIGGRTAAEVVFYLLLSGLHQSHVIDTHALSPRDIGQHISRTIERARSLGLSPGNLVVTNGRTLVAACIDKPLFVRRLTADADRHAHGFEGALVVSDEAVEQQGFEQIPRGSLVLSHRDMNLELVTLEN